MRLPIRLPAWAHTPVHDTVAVIAISVVVASAFMAFDAVSGGLSAGLRLGADSGKAGPVKIEFIRKVPSMRKATIQKRLELRRQK